MYSFIYQFPGITKEETKNKKLKVIDVVYGKSPSFLKKGQEKDLFHNSSCFLQHLKIN